MVDDLTSPIGLVAGSGILPIEFAKSARAKGLELALVAHRGEALSELEKYASSCTWIRVGQLGKLISALKRAHVKQVAFAGGISRVRLFKDVRLDWRGAALLAKLGSVKDDVVLRGIAAEIEKEGIQVISATLLLDKSVPSAGRLTRLGLDTQSLLDAIVGWEAAEAIGRLDIGQTVVANKGLVVAVEAVEGTDAAIKRAGQLSGPGGVVVKLCKPQQDTRLDLPTIGVGTIQTMKEAGASALVLQAERCIILDPQAVAIEADRAGIAVEVVATVIALKDRIAPNK
ncbi:MAG: UDP-2,3-diacylglucosamine diphosphatase LpxI [Oligoflexia bacterium]|nr:UDP-2,3-diacylglucosamine diphosphatase LpxI [Oligoflexia bacterium]